MDDKSSETRPNYKISENARKAKLNFLSSNVRPTYTTIWETITIEESISEDGNTFVRERIPFDLGGEYSGQIHDVSSAKNEESGKTTGHSAYNKPQTRTSDERPSGYESPNDDERPALQRPSTTDLMFDSSRPSTSNGQLPSSTKSLSPKHLSRAAVFNEHSLRSRLNRNLQFKLDDEKLDDENLDNVNSDNFDADRTSEERSYGRGDEIAANYGGLTDDFDKFKNNRSLSPTDRQLAKWMAIKRFKTVYRATNERPDSGRPTGLEPNLSGQNWLERNLSDPNWLDQQRYPAVDQRQAASEQPVQPFEIGQRIEQSPYKRATPDEVNDQNLFDSSSEQSGEQIPLEISDYYGSLEDSNTRLSDKEDDEFDDNLVNFGGNLESNPEDELERSDDRPQRKSDFHKDLDEQRDAKSERNLDKQRKSAFQRDLQNQINLRNQRIQRSSPKDRETELNKPASADHHGLSAVEQTIQIELESDQEELTQPTPRASTVVSELNEHNFIDLDDHHPLTYEQCLEAAQPNRSDRTTADTQQSDQQSNGNRQTGVEIDEEFDKLFLDYPEIDKFLNNLNSPTNSASNDLLVNIHSPAHSTAHSPVHSPVRLLVHSPVDSPVSRPIRLPHQSDAHPASYGQHLSYRNQSPYGEPLLNQPTTTLVEKRIPSEILEIEEPLIISRNSSRPQSSPSIRQSVKRRSVVVQTSRPTSLMTNDGDDEIKHLLTITKHDKLTNCYPIKDVYVINRTVYQIQKLSSFVLEFRNQLALIRGKLKRRAFPAMDEHPEDQPTEQAKEESKWNSFKLILKWTIANLFTTPGLAFILVCYCLIGAFLFKILERDNNLREIRQMTQYRNETVYNLLQLSSRSLSKNEFVSNAEQILRVFEDEVIEKVEMNGYSGNATDKWDLSDSFLYSVTVISTIGYGKLSPKTFAGQLVTILYAVLGIPIMLLFITNLGTIMASIFRVSYDTICCYICNLGKEEELNQDSSNPPVTVSEQLATDPKMESAESKSNKKKSSVSQQPEQANAGDADQQPSGARLQDQNLETEDSIVVFQNNEYHTNVKERAYYLTFNGEPIHKNRVPIRIVVLIVICYICLGGLLFSAWESNEKDDDTGSDFFKWTYFCFITLSTIGFGDIVPGDLGIVGGVKQSYFEGSAQILFCCVYLIFGLALLAMSFNLMQEQVILKMRKICESLGMDVRKRTLTY